MPDADGEAEETKRPFDAERPGVANVNERVSVHTTPAHRSSKNPKSISSSSNRRSIDEIDRDEIMSAIREVSSSVESLEPETAIIQIARVLGFRRTGARMKERLRSALRTAIRRHIINRDKGVISIECATIDDYTRDELVETLLVTMGSAWWDREEAIRAASRRLGFRRTGNRITKAFKSAINGALRRGKLEPDGRQIRKKYR